MKYEINYEGIEKEEKILNALKDIEFWFNNQKIFIKELNKEMYITDLLFDAAISGFYTYKQFSFSMKFAGVQGYPVLAFWKDARNSCQDMTQ